MESSENVEDLEFFKEMIDMDFVKYLHILAIGFIVYFEPENKLQAIQIMVNDGVSLCTAYSTINKWIDKFHGN